MRVLIFGAGGMLGQAVAKEAKGRIFPQALHDGIGAVIEISHDLAAIHDRDAVRVVMEHYRPDVVINAAGVLPNIFGKSGIYGGGDVAMVMTNALGPHVLAAECKAVGAYLIHISTDCVFSGQGPINDVDDPPEPRDMYGRSKLLGETLQEPFVTVARTSFIGFEHGLLAWFIDAALRGASVEGYRNAWWSGSSVNHVARAIVNLAFDRPGGLQHIALTSPIRKSHLLHLINTAFGFHVEIRDVEQPFIGRGLAPTIVLPSIETAVAELAEEYHRRLGT